MLKLLKNRYSLLFLRDKPPTVAAAEIPLVAVFPVSQLTHTQLYFIRLNTGSTININLEK